MKNRPLWIVVFTVGIDAFGFGILLPVIPTLLTNPASPHYLLSPGTTRDTGYLLIGCLTAMFPVMQFFSTPILGQLSDRFGRKPVLAISLAGTSLGYVLFAVGVLTKNVPLLFVARGIDGITGGNISVANAVIADITEPKDRTKTFGLTMGAFGSAMILGPLVGGTFADSSLVSWFNAATPFWFAAILAAVNTGFVLLFLPETRKTRKTDPIKLTRNLKNLARAFVRPQLRPIFGAQFFASAGNAFFITFFGVFLIQRFGFDEGQIGHFFGYIGACVIFTQFVTLRRMAKKFSEPKILRVTLLGASLMVAAYVLPHSTAWLFAIAPCVSTFNGLSLVNLTGLLSRTAGPEAQGEVMGIGQSVQALASAVPPLLAGSVASVLSPEGIVLAAAAAQFAAWSVFTTFYRGDV